MDKDVRKRLQKRAREILAQRDAAAPDPQESALFQSLASLSGVNAYLLALGQIYEDSNTGATYRLERLKGSADDPKAAMLQHLDEPHYSITVTPLDDWQRTLVTHLPTWIFGGGALSAAVRTRLVETLVLLLARTLNDPATCWSVDVETNRGPFYACYATDYIFPTLKGLYLLHMDISD